MTLSPTLTPPERMAEIRKLVRDIEALVADACHLHAEANRALVDTDVDADDFDAFLLAAENKLSSRDDAMTDLLNHLYQAEAEGSLAECEQMLRVSYGGAA